MATTPTRKTHDLLARASGSRIASRQAEFERLRLARRGPSRMW